MDNIQGGTKALLETPSDGRPTATHGNTSQFKSFGDDTWYIPDPTRARAAVEDGRPTATHGNTSRIKSFGDDTWYIPDPARAAVEDEDGPTEASYENPYLKAHAEKARAAGFKVKWTPSTLVVSETEQTIKSSNLLRSAPKWFLEELANEAEAKN